MNYLDYEFFIKGTLDKKKGQVLNEFEKVCPTEKSFIRVKKDVHDIFDELGRELSMYITLHKGDEPVE